MVEAILKTVILEEEFDTKPSIAAATVLSIDELIAQAKAQRSSVGMAGGPVMNVLEKERSRRPSHLK